MTLDEAIESVLRTLEGADVDDVHPEFLRGQINLLAEMFPMIEKTTSERMAEIEDIILVRKGQI